MEEIEEYLIELGFRLNGVNNGIKTFSKRMVYFTMYNDRTLKMTVVPIDSMTGTGAITCKINTEYNTEFYVDGIFSKKLFYDFYVDDDILKTFKYFK